MYYNMDEYGPGKAVDGVLTTRWATDGDVNECWIELDLGSEKWISTALIREEFSPRATGFALSMKRRVEDSYELVVTGGEIGDEIKLTFARVQARYVRLDLSAARQGGPTVSEFHVFESEPY